MKRVLRILFAVLVIVVAGTITFYFVYIAILAGMAGVG